MNIQRRRFISLSAATALTPLLSRLAQAETYPSRPVRLVVGFAAGGATDVIARIAGNYLSDHLRQPFVVENRTGAGGSIATDAVVRSPADGYTLLLAGLNDAVNASLYANLKYDFMRDIALITNLISQPLAMVVHPSVPAKTVSEFIAYTKKHPGQVNMASAGVGTQPHLAGELFKMKTGANLVHVPYRGGAPAINDLLAGRVQVIFISELLSLQHVKTGALRALAVTSTKRSAAQPDVPALNEFIPGYEASFWAGLGTPRETPADVVGIIGKAANAALADAGVKKRFAEIGGTALGGGPADFKAFFAGEAEKWREVIEFAKIKKL